MSVENLIPVADAIPVSWGWLYFFLILTFVLHLLFMNVMLGSAIMAFVGDMGRLEPSPSRDISKNLPYTIAFTINMGVAPLLFLQVLYGHFIYVSSVLMAVYWLSVIGLLIVLYYSAYVYAFRFDAAPNARTFFIGCTAVLGLVVAFLFTNNMTLMLRPETWRGYFSGPAGTLLNLGDPMLWPRYLHFVVASIALGGLFQALRAHLRGSLPDRAQRIEQGMKWFSYATATQVVIGVWFLIALPRDIMFSFMGGTHLNTAIFSLGLAAAVVTLIFGFTNRVWPAVGSTLVTVVFMAVMRDLVRTELLKPYFQLSDLTVAPQYSPMVVFLMVLVLGLGLVVYMLNLAAKSKQEAQ